MIRKCILDHCRWGYIRDILIFPYIENSVYFPNNNSLGVPNYSYIYLSMRASYTWISESK